MCDASDPRWGRRWAFPNRLAQPRRTKHECRTSRSDSVRVQIRYSIRIGNTFNQPYLPVRLLEPARHAHTPPTPPRSAAGPVRLASPRIRAGPRRTDAGPLGVVARLARHSVLCAVCAGVYAGGARWAFRPRSGGLLNAIVFGRSCIIFFLVGWMGKGCTSCALMGR